MCNVETNKDNNNKNVKPEKKVEKRMDTVMIVDSFDDSNTAKYLDQFAKIENELKRVKDKKLGKKMYPKLTVRVSSCGGDVYVANMIISFMEKLKKEGVEVNTECCGYAYSSGLLVFMHGMKRTFMNKDFCFIMWHQVALGTYDKMDNVKNYVNFIDTIWNVHEKYLLNNTALTKELLLEKTNSTNEWYINYKEAKKLGIVTE